ncbi:tRNA (guanine(9)-N(1))-methyltransferase [Mitosporidium daphniae]|uniref:tRNA (guanine(9)-N1)-methyltransferase n=1 Tax=Mitosporidium daphniae TaxID=1485682 RepID=A0A098VVC6_9MICR|nr:uncharacterized protein DI09_29p120 [Mitosporidium daphniae]KGG51691.1 hypothetical protein DI09_29p120 [Mitosporidium daphniae]|eukprot:XP_013238118.1 uncharacterized protein DI09_29p120 [Mitosporidium daphniae]
MLAIEQELATLFASKSYVATTELKSEAPKSKNQIRREARSALRKSLRSAYCEAKREKQRQKRAKSARPHTIDTQDSPSEIDKGDTCGAVVLSNCESPMEIKPASFATQPPNSLETLNSEQTKENGGWVLFDTAFDELMLPKERSSLAAQLARCHGMNKRSPSGFCKMLIGPISPDFSLLLEKYCAILWKNVTLFAELPKKSALPSLKGEDSLFHSEEQAAPAPGKGATNLKILYLSADAEHVLTESEMNDPELCIVIGALVDRNRHKGAGMRRAQELGIPAARLPIQESGVSLNSSTVLTVNQGSTLCIYPSF